MNTFILLLAAAAIAYGVAHMARLPALPVLIVTGMAVNLMGWLPAGFVPGSAGGEDLSGGAIRVLEFGLVFLVFASGVELNPRRFAKHFSAVLWIGCVQFLASAAAGFAAASWIMGFGALESTYLGIGVAVSSTVVVLRNLRLRQAMFEPFGRVVTGSLLVQDGLLVVALVLLARVDGSWVRISIGLGEVVLLGVAAWFAQRHVVPALLRRIKPDEESLLLWLIAVMFSFVWISMALGLPPIVGAFFGGFTFSSFPLNSLIRGQLASLTEFFQALFFVMLGALLGVPEAGQWLTAGQLALVVLIVTPPLVAVLAEWRGLNARASIESGLMLAQISELSLLLCLAGVSAGHVSQSGFEVLALAAVMTMSLTPFLGRSRLAQALLPLHPFRTRGTQCAEPEGHVLILGLGASGMWTVKPLIAAGHRVVVVDDDAIVCRQLEQRGIEVIHGDAADVGVLHRAGASRARLVVSSLRRVQDSLTVLRVVSGVPVMVRVFEDQEFRSVERAGGIPIHTADAAADVFMAWLETNDREGIAAN
ncbi:cation:proton antiporter [Sulfuriroseicoccus oceanibius]|uniref:Cation:proton antiporter n=1 Tax=Sulfuriroseicoccus oceanibius TaxID=2707525 RepID=A0A6B3LDU5_9BACT|nr:cation:proton antiporter [Sulfuriroseicoccus oceanibius]QQL44447.1 cation:proton antiporter [Sulfuriroseicoccus oceanibius]